eukprot:TRINITY_DN11084_c0_g2_i3.p3 TRINITY_DN11084_c0_g2~~TRINITY_DN11084_c0_g2_i3.p3  ORF type:complete len:237 (+),score=-20.99 TRINITY_DN11084_c0_g2_i3:317-1027(+)
MHEQNNITCKDPAINVYTEKEVAYALKTNHIITYLYIQIVSINYYPPKVESVINIINLYQHKNQKQIYLCIFIIVQQYNFQLFFNNKKQYKCWLKYLQTPKYKQSLQLSDKNHKFKRFFNWLIQISWVSVINPRINDRNQQYIAKIRKKLQKQSKMLFLNCFYHSDTKFEISIHLITLQESILKYSINFKETKHKKMQVTQKQSIYRIQTLFLMCKNLQLLIRGRDLIYILQINQG